MENDTYCSSCGRCGQDFEFATREERLEWFDDHDADHIDFISFFRGDQ